MPIVINYKICDKAPECGGIEVCPNGAFYWNEKEGRPEVDNQKCTSCRVCIRNCPVGAIIFVQNEQEKQKILKEIEADPRPEADLWKEKLGCQPGKTAPLATVVDSTNFSEEILDAGGVFVLDVWSEETLDCRFHSLSWSELGVSEKILLKKLDGGKFPDLADKLEVVKFPTLIVFKNGREVGRKEGYLYGKDRKKLQEFLVGFFR